MTQHTPGPWSLTSFDGTQMAEVRVDGKLACLLHSFSRKSTLEDEANARLIAAAPDLLEALQAMLDVCFDLERNDETLAAVKKSLAAIMKATGETK